MRFFGMVILAVAVAQVGSEVAATPAKVVDMSVAAKQPNLRVVENKLWDTSFLRSNSARC